ncbi:MAG: UDP-N-acetylmuramoyl-L-alanyl-D-glutamate--2,6-diaminopimelate ligase [Melioribacteraceae bacterium]|nr:UDP-N-acetylmuramoyl-L-alanyl-D-glutamate--2,6-diaminopimelate ligase [Melioribacteraceae bacterium]
MLLKEVIKNLNTVRTIGDIDLVEVNNITMDSREVSEGSLYIAIKGFKADGHSFIKDAIKKGASVIAVNEDANFEIDNKSVVVLVVTNTRDAMARISCNFYENPSSKLTLIGITGTKGKTTTAFYIKNIFENAGFKTGLIGTIANYIGDTKIETKLTTPESITINSLLREMVKEGCKYCVMEVSSHSLELARVQYLNFDQLIFTNITSDHLDYHKTFENYLAAKKIFFDQASSDSKAIVNKDDNNWAELTKDTKASVISYGIDNKSDYNILNVKYNLDGTEFEVDYKGVNQKLKTSLVGYFNAYNAGSAFISAVEAGMSLEKAAEGIKKTSQVPGRFEVVSSKNKKAIVDYSHTSDSLKKALEAVNHINKENRNVITVVGCGGDRDKSKRPVMGEIASRLSTKVIITSDNPRTENPNEIIKDIISGIDKDNYDIIENRREAIKKAIKESDDYSIIFIAGKGHENYQEINGVRNYFSDKETAIEFLEECEK